MTMTSTQPVLSTVEVLSQRTIRTLSGVEVYGVKVREIKVKNQR